MISAFEYAHIIDKPRIFLSEPRAETVLNDEL